MSGIKVWMKGQWVEASPGPIPLAPVGCDHVWIAMGGPGDEYRECDLCGSRLEGWAAL